MSDTYLYLEEGTDQLSERESTVISNGVPDAGRIIALDQDGKLDSSIVVTEGVTVLIEAGMNLLAGEFINIYDDAGTTKIQKASASGELFANGFVKLNYNTTDTCQVYLQGINNALTGLTIGSLYFLDIISGAISISPPTGAGDTVQQLGRAISTTSLAFDPVNPIVRS